MAVTTDFSEYEGPIPTRLRRAAAAHAEAAVVEAELALKPHSENDTWRVGADRVAVFHQHAQAAVTLREVAALFDEAGGMPLQTAGGS